MFTITKFITSQKTIIKHKQYSKSLLYRTYWSTFIRLIVPFKLCNSSKTPSAQRSGSAFMVHSADHRESCVAVQVQSPLNPLPALISMISAGRKQEAELSIFILLLQPGTSGPGGVNELQGSRHEGLCPYPLNCLRILVIQTLTPYLS